MDDNNDVFLILKVKFKRLNYEARIPTYAHGIEDAACDLYAVGNYTIPTRQTRLIGTGLALQIPLGYVGILKGRSSVEQYGLILHAGVIDSGYRGEVKVMLYNEGYTSLRVNHLQRIAQLLIIPIIHGNFTEVRELDESVRQTDGFGSTNVQELP